MKKVTKKSRLILNSLKIYFKALSCALQPLR